MKLIISLGLVILSVALFFVSIGFYVDKELKATYKLTTSKLDVRCSKENPGQISVTVTNLQADDIRIVGAASSCPCCSFDPVFPMKIPTRSHRIFLIQMTGHNSRITVVIETRAGASTEIFDVSGHP